MMSSTGVYETEISFGVVATSYIRPEGETISSRIIFSNVSRLYFAFLAQVLNMLM